MGGHDLCDWWKDKNDDDLPINGDGHEREDARADCARRDEHAEFAEGQSERPLAGQHIERVERRVEYRYQRVGHREVHQEVVRDGAHALVREHYPYDDDVSAGGHNDDEEKRDDVYQLDVPRENEQIALVVQCDVWRRHVRVRVSDVH